MPDGSYREGVASARREARLRIAQLRQERLHKRRAARLGSVAEATAERPRDGMTNATEPLFEHTVPQPPSGEDPIGAAERPDTGEASGALDASEPTDAGDAPVGVPLNDGVAEPFVATEAEATSEKEGTAETPADAPQADPPHETPDAEHPVSTTLTPASEVAERMVATAPPAAAAPSIDSAETPDEAPETPKMDSAAPPQRTAAAASTGETSVPRPEMAAGLPAMESVGPPEHIADAASSNEPAPTNPDPAKDPDTRASDLYTLPGAGVGLVWMFNQCGVQTLADLAQADPDELARDLGVIGQLIRLDSFIDYARGNANSSA
ncbi:MAG: hypothetical protein AAF771_03075 [Pseudomonadota bacterium]